MHIDIKSMELMVYLILQQIYIANRPDYNGHGYKTNGRAGRGASFKNDFKHFKSTIDETSDENMYHNCNPRSFLDGAIGGKSCYDQGGFGGGGGSYLEGGAGGGYIGGVVSPRDMQNKDATKFELYGAWFLILEKVMLCGSNDGNGKIEVEFYEELQIPCAPVLNFFHTPIEER